MKRLINPALLLFTLLFIAPVAAQAKGDDFKAVVKAIEQFYSVKHQSLPFLARAGMKTATTVGRIAGGNKRRLAEAGSVKIAFFEDQDFNSSGRSTEFRKSLVQTLRVSWLPFIQVLSGDDDQTYVFLREAAEKYQVLVITIERKEATVVQVDLSRETLARLMQDPNEFGKAITDDATSTNEQE
jgi:hypothetical protein